VPRVTPPPPVGSMAPFTAEERGPRVHIRNTFIAVDLENEDETPCQCLRAQRRRQTAPGALGPSAWDAPEAPVRGGDHEASADEWEEGASGTSEASDRAADSDCSTEEEASSPPKGRVRERAGTPARRTGAAGALLPPGERRPLQDQAAAGGRGVALNCGVATLGAGLAPGLGGSAAVEGVRGRVWRLARESHGSRLIQEAFDEGSNDDRRHLASELAGHVWQAAQCPRANFVLQKAIITMCPEDVQFIIDELPVALAAKHRTGCRIVQRLIEHCPPWQLSGLAGAIERDFSAIARSQYGNYVIQCMAEYGSEEQRMQMTWLVAQEAKSLAADPYGAAALSGAMAKGPAWGKELLARALLREQGLLVSFACTRHGCGTVIRVLQVLRGQERAEAQRLLAAQEARLRASRFGRTVAPKLQRP